MSRPPKVTRNLAWHRGLRLAGATVNLGLPESFFKDCLGTIRVIQLGEMPPDYIGRQVLEFL